LTLHTLHGYVRRQNRRWWVMQRFHDGIHDRRAVGNGTQPALSYKMKILI
jgi:hypothetical protein